MDMAHSQQKGLPSGVGEMDRQPLGYYYYVQLTTLSMGTHGCWLTILLG